MSTDSKSSATPNALTREQWAKGTVEHGQYAITLRDGQLVLHGVSTSVHVPEALRRPLAAMALQGQEGWFTREMIGAIVEEVERAACGEAMSTRGMLVLYRIVDRIAALLPPKDAAPTRPQDDCPRFPDLPPLA